MADILKFMHCWCEYNFCSQCQSVLPEDIFWDWSDWNCVIEKDDSTCWNVFIPVWEYNFNNLTICEWVKLRFCWEWVPIIRVKENFINDWCIILRNPLVCCSCTLYEPLLWKQITTTKNDCYDCALTTYNCIYDRVGTPANWKWWAWWAKTNSCSSSYCYCNWEWWCWWWAWLAWSAWWNGTGNGYNTACWWCGWAGWTSAYANAWWGWWWGWGMSRCNYSKAANWWAWQNAPGDWIWWRWWDWAGPGYRCCNLDWWPWGWGWYWYRQWWDWWTGWKSNFNFWWNYYACISHPGWDWWDSYMWKWWNGWAWYYVTNCYWTWGNWWWSYYWDWWQWGLWCTRWGWWWSMFWNWWGTYWTYWSKLWWSSIYWNAWNWSTKWNWMSWWAISWWWSYWLWLFVKNFNLHWQIWWPWFSWTSYSSKSSNIYIVTWREYHCDWCICNKWWSCNWKLYIYNTNY